jgi:perosamine synthetase
MATFNRLGYNLRLSDIQAAVGVAQMAKLDRLLAERRARAHRYTRLLAQIDDLQLPQAGDVAGHSFQSYVIRVFEGGRPRRNDAMTALQEAGIQTRPGTHAAHRLGYYARKYALRSGDFPNAVIAEDTTITLPIFPGMTDAQQDHVVDLIVRALKT